MKRLWSWYKSKSFHAKVLYGILGIILGTPALILSLFLLGGLLMEFVPHKDPAPAASAPSPPTRPIEPPLTNVVVHAYSLLKDPFGHRGQVVTLNVTERPLIYEGSAIRYIDTSGGDAGMGAEMGMMGLRLNRMMSEEMALYDILGTDADGASRSSMLGQLVVVLPTGQRSLDLGRFWEVEPLGVVEGTNGFGAPIQVPEVRFWRYADERHRRAEPASR